MRTGRFERVCLKDSSYRPLPVKRIELADRSDSVYNDNNGAAVIDLTGAFYDVEVYR